MSREALRRCFMARFDARKLRMEDESLAWLKRLREALRTLARCPATADTVATWQRLFDHDGLKAGERLLINYCVRCFTGV